VIWGFFKDGYWDEDALMTWEEREGWEGPGCTGPSG